MAYLDLIARIHGATKRDYAARVFEGKAEAAAVSKQFGFDYFDGDRRYGYGGYVYDGRWQALARDLADRYGLAAGQRVLDVGSAKGFLLHDLLDAVPGIEVAGVDVSEYAIENTMEAVRPFVRVADATELPFPDDSFDLVLSINTLHNLRLPELELALREIERVGKGSAYLVLDGYRDEREKLNLMSWQITCECFYTPDEWQWIFDRVGYRGDFGCIYYG